MNDLENPQKSQLKVSSNNARQTKIYWPQKFTDRKQTSDTFKP